MSRVRTRVTPSEQQSSVNDLRRILAAYRDAEDLIQIGAYVKGADPDVDRAVDLMPTIRAYLSHAGSEDANLQASARSLGEILNRAEL